MNGLHVNDTERMPLVRVYAPLGYLMAYLVTIMLGRQAVVEGSEVALFWPAAGVAALWILRGTSKRQVVLDLGLLFGGTTLLLVGLGGDPLGAVLLAAAGTVQGFVVRAALAWWRGLRFAGSLTPGVASTRDLLELAAASVLASVLSSPLGMAGLWLSRDQASWGTAVAWVVRNACGTYVVAAVVLTVVTACRNRRHRVITAEPRPYAGLELIAATIMTVLCGALVFTAPERRPIAFVMVATSTWIGLRFSPVVGAVHAFALGTVAVLGTVADLGPFRHVAGVGPFGIFDTLTRQAMAVQVFIAICTTLVLLLAFGASERAALTTRLRESRLVASQHAGLLDAVTSVMEDGLIVIDATGKVLLSNPAAEQMAGLEPGSPGVGRARTRGLFRLDGSELPESELPSTRALQGEVVPPTDLLRIHPRTGGRTILSISGTLLHAGTADSPAAAVLVVRDVTTARAQRRELESFAGVVAHDLKEPLTGVIAWSEMLADQLADPGVTSTQSLHASLEWIRGSAERMDNLIVNLLAYSRTQSGELALQSVLLEEIVDQVVFELRELHHQRMPLVEHPPLGRVLADRTLVHQLLINLLGNAVKYVAPGVTPHIVIGSAPMGGMLEISVTDNGIGIPDEDLGHVFDSFFRVPNTLGYPGTGLGLAICARTVERHGGRITARQGPEGHGTTIAFSLPLDPAPDGARPNLERISAS